MNFDDERLEQLILDGIVEFAGLDKNGEMLYSFSPDIQEKAPMLYEMMMAEHMNSIYILWEAGFLDMDITSPSPIVRITKKALDDDEIDKLDPRFRVVLEQIIDYTRQSGE